MGCCCCPPSLDTPSKRRRIHSLDLFTRAMTDMPHEGKAPTLSCSHSRTSRLDEGKVRGQLSRSFPPSDPVNSDGSCHQPKVPGRT